MTFEQSSLQIEKTAQARRCPSIQYIHGYWKKNYTRWELSTFFGNQFFRYSSNIFSLLHHPACNNERAEMARAKKIKETEKPLPGGE